MNDSARLASAAADGPPLPLPTSGGDSGPGYQGGKEFFVDRQQLSGLTGLLDRTSEDGKATHDFVVRHTKLDGGEGWISELAEPHPTIVDNVTAWLKQLHGTTLSGTADGVRSTVSHYRGTDNGNAKSLDASVPKHQVSVDRVPQSLDEELGIPQPIFAYPTDPQLRLQDPPDYSNSNEYKWEPSFWDVLSASSHIRNAFQEVTEFLSWIGLMDGPIDPFDAWTKPVVGDWAGLRASADAFKVAAGACQDMAFNISRSRSLLEPVWRGNAADACVTHLGSVSDAMFGAHAPLSDLSDAYILAADAAAEYRKTVDAIIGEICDLAIALGATIAASGGTAGVSGGASLILGGILGIWPVYRFIDLCHSVNNARKTAQGVKDTAMGRIKSAMTNIDSALPRLPAVGSGSTVAELPG